MSHSVALVLSVPLNGTGVSADSFKLGDLKSGLYVHDDVEAPLSSSTLQCCI